MVLATPTTAIHAVITDDGAYTREGQILPFKRPLKHASEVELLARRTGVTHFWIMPSSHIDGLGYQFLEEKEGYKIFIPGGKSASIPPSTAVISRSGGSEVHVEYPGSARWAWKAETPEDILDVLSYLSEHIDARQITHSPQYIGKQQLKADYDATNRLQSYLVPPKYKLSDLPFNRAAPELFFVSKTVISRARVGLYIIVVDKNGAHPSAAQSARMGYSELTHHEALGPVVMPTQQGIYRVSYEVGNSVFNGARLPEIIASEWINLEVLKFARKNGYKVDVLEGYVFKNSHQFFKKWVPHFFEIRKALKDRARYTNEIARATAEETIKSVMNYTISSLKDHPNWWTDMVSLARVARLANLAKIEKDHGFVPLCCYVDDMAFVHGYTDDPEKAIPGITARSTELGGYKHRFSLQITKEMLSDLRDIANAKYEKQQIFAMKMHGYLKMQAVKKGLIDG